MFLSNPYINRITNIILLFIVLIIIIITTSSIDVKIAISFAAVYLCVCNFVVAAAAVIVGDSGGDGIYAVVAKIALSCHYCNHFDYYQVDANADLP